jgi:hypothetical protein
MHTNAPRTETKRGSRMLNRNAITLDRAPASAPTAIGRTGPSEYNSALHDIVGRRYVVGLNYKF